MLPHTSSSNARPRGQLALASQPSCRPVSTTIATLKDALAFPEQQPQLAPLHKPRATTVTTTSPPNYNNSKNKKKKSNPRKKFPRGLARFRDRLQHLEERLRLDVNALKQEICDLTLRRGLVETRTLTTRFCTTGSAAKLVHEYFITFQYGSQGVPANADLLGVTTNNYSSVTLTPGFRQDPLEPPLLLLQQQVEAAKRQNAFIEGLLDARMEFRKYVGRDVLREQWQRYSQCHAGLRMHLFSITTASTADNDRHSPDYDKENDENDLRMDDCDASTVVHTTGELTAYITQQTLEEIFPNVLHNPGLAQRLLGVYIEYPFCIEFHVSADGKITKYDPDVDFVSALSKVLGNLDDVTLLMRDAVISEYCMIGALDMYPVVTSSSSDEMDGGSEPESSDSLEAYSVDRDGEDRHEATRQNTIKTEINYILS